MIRRATITNLAEPSRAGGIGTEDQGDPQDWVGYVYRRIHVFLRQNWVGKFTTLLEPLADAIGRHVLAGQAIFADDTPVKMMTPGTGERATACLWAYGRDERP